MVVSTEFERFVIAQHRVYDQVRRELTVGRKKTHWMWFIFPQIAGLGRSEMSRKFAIKSIDEARRYLRHGILGARLRECTQLVLRVQNRKVEDIFGYPDDLKFRSSMTLFALCAPEEALFRSAIEKYFEGGDDPATVDLLGKNERCD